jgi:hypothetical protein
MLLLERPGHHDGKAPCPVVLTTTQQNALAGLADYIVPPDSDPGGWALGVVSYVEQVLTALDGTPQKVFAGGPYSGRQPYARPDGTPSTNYPPDSFTTFVPLDRYRLAAWQLRLKGSDNVPGGGINDAVLGKTIGWQTQVTTALDAAIAAISVPLDATTPAADVKEASEATGLDGKELITELVIEGCFSSPEYGGNKYAHDRRAQHVGRRQHGEPRVSGEETGVKHRWGSSRRLFSWISPPRASVSVSRVDRRAYFGESDA